MTQCCQVTEAAVNHLLHSARLGQTEFRIKHVWQPNGGSVGRRAASTWLRIPLKAFIHPSIHSFIHSVEPPHQPHSVLLEQ